MTIDTESARLGTMAAQFEMQAMRAKADWRLYDYARCMGLAAECHASMLLLMEEERACLTIS